MLTMMKRLLMIVAAVVSVAALAYSQSHSRVYTFNESGKRGYLGVELEDVTQRLKDRKHLTVDAGAYVQEVVEDSPAEKAGIDEGDVITKFDGKEISDAVDLTNAVRREKPKTEVKIEVMRKSERKTLTATLGKVPGNYGYSFSMPRMPVLPKLPRTPRSPHAFSFSSDNELYGLEVEDLSKQLAEYFEVPNNRGVLTTSVERGSSADRAGFKAGDVLVKIGGEMIHDVEDVHEAVDDARDGKDVSCEVFRKGKSVQLTWHIERDDDEDDDNSSDESYAPTTDDCPRLVGALSPVGSISQLSELKVQFKTLEAQLKEKIAQIKAIIQERVSLLWQLSGNV